MKVAVFVGTRADLGPLLPVVRALVGAGAEPTLLTGVAFDAQRLVDLVMAELDMPLPVEQLATPVEAVTPVVQREQGRAITAGLADLLDRTSFDRLVVLGDRWELLFVVPQFFLAEVPIVHLHGGEVTEGVIDERVRHAVTKLADLHCVASQDAADRLRQMGEQDERIHVTGAPGLDRFVGLDRADDEALADLVGRPVVRPLALFTYHPPTAVPAAQTRRWAREALEATLAACGTVVATHPGFDVGREEILGALNEVAAADESLIVIESLGRGYPRMLASCDVVVGNSSSGVIEAASVGVPAVDIGERQRGRLRGDNVVWSAEGAEAVRAALATALDPEFGERARGVVNPYGDGTAAQRIAEVVLADAPPRAKPFVDVRS